MDRRGERHVRMNPFDRTGVLLGVKGTEARAWFRRLRSESRFKIVVLAAAAGTIQVCLFLLFYHGFRFLYSPEFVDLADWIVRIGFSVFFFCLGVMLLFSVGITSFIAMYRSRETAFLMVHPVPHGSIFLQRLAESLGFSAWAFLFLSFPMLVALAGARTGESLLFLPLAAVVLLLFVLIPGALGALVAMGVALGAPRGRRIFVWGGLLLIVAGLAVGGGWLATLGGTSHRVEEEHFIGTLDRFKFSDSPLLPSSWATGATLAAFLGRTGDWVFYGLLVAANAAFLTMAGGLLAHRTFATGWSSSQAGLGRSRFRVREGVLRLLRPVLFLVERDARLLLEKDLRTFFRDAAQWSQFLIFFGLLGTYFYNLNVLPIELGNPVFNNVVSFLNLGATGMTLCTFTSRFVFPMLSLEGRRFWVLGLLPLDRGALMRGKFAFSVLMTLTVSVPLILLSDAMLQVEPEIRNLHLATVVFFSLALSGMSVGLGAIFPDFKETNPSKIVSGFGGTLNLVAGLAFIVAVVLIEGFFVHFSKIKGEFVFFFRDGEFDPAVYRRVLVGVVLGIAALSAAVGILPFRAGRRAFDRLEF